MNILVIGNGFDLAHGLPTKYTDFLFFCSSIKYIIEDNKIGDKIPLNDIDYNKWLENDKEVLLSNVNFDNDSYINNCYFWNYRVTERDKKEYSRMLDDFIKTKFLGKEKDQKILKEVIYLVFNNFWIEYFLKHNLHGEENWIDFESEIYNVVKAIDDQMHKKHRKCSLYDKLKEWPDNSLRLFFEKEYGKEVTYKELRDKLEKDLNKLIRLFEIYLAEYVEKIDVTIISPDIKEIVHCFASRGGMDTNLYSKVLSFNYTSTYERVYWNENNYISKCGAYMDYIHGKAKINNKIEKNNMVLGIDEYLGKKKRNKYVEFISFKKFYQRIYKKTGCKYKKWVESIQKDITNEKTWIYDNHEYFKDRFYNLFFFGHSLDITDKDILRDLILNDNVHTTIFYHDKDTMGQQIANLVKVIGEDELIRRTGGSAKTIEFVLQKQMVPINEQEVN